MNKVTPKVAAENGFATFNNGLHTCIDITDDHETITLRMPDGKRITIAVLDKNGVVDVATHDVEKMEVLVLGAGPTYYRTAEDDEPTIAVVRYRERVDIK